MGSPLVALGALLLELVLGYPERLYRRIGHPVSWMGAQLAALERRLNIETASFAARRMRGIVALLILLAVTAGIAVALAWLFRISPYGKIGELVVVATLFAPRSLRDHVLAVARALEAGGIQSARRAVARIVGRDPDSLDEAGICRAAIESLAENYSDGFVAPLFWYLLGGLPGVALYKAINTADSMIGHKSARYEAFGWAAARLDDLVNLPASRLTALLVAIVALTRGFASSRASFAAVFRDASKHRSPNAGWPEAAMAGALALKLAGPRIYDGKLVQDHWMGDGRSAATAHDIERAIRLTDIATGAICAVLALAALIRL